MAFFDDLSKKLTQAGQTAAQKTKEIAEIAKLNSQISDEDKRIESNYLQIGKLYVSLHGENSDGDFAELISAIRESEKKIAEYRQQISDIKGIVKCEKCGAEVANGAAFCSSCGAPMPVVAPVEETVAEPSATEEAAPATEAQDDII